VRLGGWEAGRQGGWERLAWRSRLAGWETGEAGRLGGSEAGRLWVCERERREREGEREIER